MTPSTAMYDPPLDRVAATRARYLGGAENVRDMRPVVVAAWERSRAYGVNPYRLRPQTADEDRLAAARDRSRALLDSAEPFLRLVHDELVDEPHLVALADADCVILRTLTGPDVPADLEASNLFEGASWHERDLGSNGVGTAIATGEPVILRGPEHFQESYVGWTCIGVPIRGSDGALAGALDLSIPNEHAHRHAWGWALSLARGIEASLVATAAAGRHEAGRAIADIQGRIREVDAVLERLAGRLDVAPDVERLTQARTALGRMDADLERATHRLESAIEERDRLLALVNHDLRAPLSTIVMATALLLEDVPGEKKRAQAVRIRRATDQMTRLVEDLLDVAQLEHGRLSLTPKPCQADALARAAVDSCGPLARARSVVLRADPETDRTVLADEQRMLQVFTNLIGNAIDHTPEGGRITVRTREADGAVLFQVEDTGTGIAAEHLPHIFDRFWQANRSGRAGAGLGLAIARGIVEAHGGEIRVASEPGHGSTFSFTLPEATDRDSR
jgi:signal transduction histidine kinase